MLKYLRVPSFYAAAHALSPAGLAALQPGVDLRDETHPTRFLAASFLSRIVSMPLLLSMHPGINIVQFDVAGHNVARACGGARLKAGWLMTTTALLAPPNTLLRRTSAR